MVLPIEPQHFEVLVLLLLISYEKQFANDRNHHKLLYFLDFSEIDFCYYSLSFFLALMVK